MEKFDLKRIKYEYIEADKIIKKVMEGDFSDQVKNDNIEKCHKILIEFDEEVFLSLQGLFLINGWNIEDNCKDACRLLPINFKESEFLDRFGKDLRKFEKFKEDGIEYILLVSEFEGIVILQRIRKNIFNDMIIYWKEKCSEGSMLCENGRLIHKLKSDCIDPYDLGNF